jgi:hypothetical protein
MANRRMDAFYFALLLTVFAIGYYASNRTSEEELPSLDLSVWETPELELEAPFDFPYDVVRFRERPNPRLVLSDDMESVLVEVRSALLESSTTLEIRPTEQLAAVVD